MAARHDRDPNGAKRVSANLDLVERSANLKQQLLEFAQRPRYERALSRVLDNSEDPINAFDEFVLQRRQPGGQTLVDHFVAARRDLSESEREIVLGWRDVVEGLFEVERQDGDALIVLNLVDELTYRVRSNMGREVWKQTPKRSFTIARLVPVGNEWLISGTIRAFPATSREAMYQTAAQLAVNCPNAVFRNPAKLAQGWEMQREERFRFIAFFGADQFIVSGPELAGRMREYLRYMATEALARKAASPDRRDVSTPPPLTEWPLPPDLREGRAVGVIYDEVDGLLFHPDLDWFEAVFEDPKRTADRDHRRTVLGYLRSDSISPAPFRRVAKRDPARASQVFQRLLKRPGFSWERDGEKLLQKRKPWYFEAPPRPSVTPMSDRLAPHFVRPTDK